MLEASCFALDLPSMPVHCIAARQHTKVIATASGGISTFGGGGAELRQPGGRLWCCVGGNVHAKAWMLRGPHEDVKATCLERGLLPQADRVLVEDVHRRHPHDRRTVGRGAGRAHAFVLEEAREGDDRLVGRCELGRAVGAVERRALLVGQNDGLVGGDAAQEQLERDQHGRHVDAHPLAHAGHDGPLAHLQAHVCHRVRGESRATVDQLGSDLRVGLGSLA